jgi:hypothetical protein
MLGLGFHDESQVLLFYSLLMDLYMILYFNNFIGFLFVSRLWLFILLEQDISMFF